jgi:acetyltransferase
MGGVALNLETPAEVLEVARKMADRFVKHHPGASLHGFTVQPMISRPHAIELIIGVFEDAQFGPVILFGQGGTAVEIIHDKALALPPLNMNLAREVMTHTRVYNLLQGYRNTPAADLDAIVLTLIKVSQLVCDFAEIKELDINPLLADASGVIALDARIRVGSASGDPAERLAIRPYPRELEEVIALPAGGDVLLRPIKPEDEVGFQELFDSLPPEDIRMRFLHPMKTLGHKMAARLTQIDYDREMALVLEGKDGAGKSILLGGVRI